MTEQQPPAGGTESSGFPQPEIPEGFTPVPPGQPAAPELAASPEALGQQALADGAEPAGVTAADLQRMFDQIADLQKRVAQQEAAAAQAAKGDAAKFARALQAHMVTKSQSVHTAAQGDSFAPALELAAELVKHTSGEDGAEPGQVPDLLGKVGRWLRSHARAYPSDLAYLEELADELADAHETEQAAA
jgi:hypothetical protein